MLITHAVAEGSASALKLPAALKVVLENIAVDLEDGKTVSVDDIKAFADWAKMGGQTPRNRLPPCARVDAGFHRCPPWLIWPRCGTDQGAWRQP